MNSEVKTKKVETGEVPQLSEAQSHIFFHKKIWNKMSPGEIAMFQTEQEKICMPFSVYQNAISETLGYRAPSWFVALCSPKTIRAKIVDKIPHPITFGKVVSML